MMWFKNTAMKIKTDATWEVIDRGNKMFFLNLAFDFLFHIVICWYLKKVYFTFQKWQHLLKINFEQYEKQNKLYSYEKKNCGKKNRIPLTKYEKNVYFKLGCHFYLWITIQNLVVPSAGKENWPSHSLLVRPLIGTNFQKKIWQ